MAADGFRTLSRCHALFHPIALAFNALSFAGNWSIFIVGGGGVDGTGDRTD
jgi:hypothetical protein